MIDIKNLSYSLPNGIKLINNLSFCLNDQKKVALIGPNGIGKSTLIKIIMNEIEPNNGKITKNNLNIAYMPQQFNKLNFNTIADVFNLEKQVISITKVDKNNADTVDYINLEGFWDCVEVISKKLDFFNLKFNPLQKFSNLSGGEKVKVILSSIIKKETNFLILDEPTNNMDNDGKVVFYDFVKNFEFGLLLISHDRELLDLVNEIYEIRKLGSGNTEIYNYGCNFSKYIDLKKLENISIERKYNVEERKLEKQKQQIIKNKEIRSKKVRQGIKNAKNKRYTKTAYDFKINKSEKKQGKLSNRDNKNLDKINMSIKSITNVMERKNEIYFKLDDHSNIYDKIIFQLNNFDFSYHDKQIFKNFNFVIRSTSRIAINGKNGSGKSTLLKIIAKNFNGNFAFLDQEQNFLDNSKTILENIIHYTRLNNLEARNVLAQFAFRTDSVDKKVDNISGGERIRLAISCVLSKNPDLLLMDEPTNNLDLDSISILENILKQYKKALVLVSHDKTFIKNININDFVNL